MSPEESAERYFGIERKEGYAIDFKVTSPARTVCDLLMALERNLRRVDSDRGEVASDTAFDALMGFAIRHDLADARAMALQLGYGRSVLHHIQFAERYFRHPIGHR